MKKTNLKNNLFKLFVASLALIVAISLAPLGGQAARQAHADGPYEEFVETVEVAQSQFEVGDLSSMPSAPSSWTGEYIGGLSGSVKSGVLTLKSAYTTNHENTRLEIYPEYKDKNSIPVTPFGKTSSNPQGGNYYENTNKNVLMINTNKSITAYGYSSHEISLEANSFYSFSAWVKTGNFAADEGAAITITGLKDPVGIWNIDTVSSLPVDKNGLPDLNQSNNWGWRQYTIYVGTGSSSESAQIRLSVGDNIDNHCYPSQGYAFFDNINVQKLSPTYYYDKISGSAQHTHVYDMNSYNYAYGSVNGTQTEIGSFTNGAQGWSKIYDEEEGSKGRIDFNTFNAGSTFIEDTSFGFNNDPFSPMGKSKVFNNIMVLSSYLKSSDSFDKVQAGIKSPDITIKKETNYLLNVWYSTQQMDGNASIVISGESTQLSTQYKITPVEVGSLSTDSNKQRYGWQRVEIFIKGSVIKDVVINIELWMGYQSEASGIAMFDDITLQEISSKEYSELSTSSTSVIIDSGAAVTTVTNGHFNEVDYADQEELKNTYPLTPTSWEFIDAQTAQLQGHSTRMVDYSNAVYGIVPTNNAHFEANKGNYGAINNPYQHDDRANKNALLMYSPTSTTFGYRSDSIGITAEAFNIIQVKLLANCTGAGASLVLKNGTRVISTIEKITNTSDTFKTYEFYVSGGTSDTTLNLEIWFGLTDRAQNTSKLSKGYVFVDSVELIGSDQETVTQKFDEYNSIANVTTRYTNFAVYRLGNFDFSAYDRYTDSTIKDAYDFTLTSTGLSTAGVVDIADKNQSSLPEYFSKANSEVEDKFNTTLVLRNNEPASSKLSSANAFGLAADTYYKIEFSLLVDIAQSSHEKAIGGGIQLGSHSIDNIRNTLDKGVVIGKDANGNLTYQHSPAFNTFTFFYATGAEAETLNWALSLGADGYTNERVAGQLFCNKITVTTLDSYYFDDELKALIDEHDAEEVNDIYGYKLIDKRVESEEVVEDEDPIETPETNPNGTESPWFLIPSIVFAIAILIALIGVIVKKLLSRRGRYIEKTVSYDRNMNVIKPVKGETDIEENDEVIERNTQAPTFDSFDDTTVEISTKQARKAARKESTHIDEFADTTAIEPIEQEPQAQKPEEKEINEFEE